MLSNPTAVTPVPGAGERPSRAVDDARRPEIEGLRAVAVLLVAVYHVWFGRVSGGVDVFLLITGFLITGSLVRSVERTGRMNTVAFWTRLLGRLSPAVGVTLLGVLAATLVFLPADRWRAALAETVAAALYYENWLLALNSVDYLAQNAQASPVQHFWSLAVQGQFYLLWPLLVAGAAILAVRLGWPLRRVVLAAVSGVFAVSLAYSVRMTATDQPWAYFDTGARLWELALGGLLAVVLPHLRLPAAMRAVMGWTGLVALLACGALVEVSTVFPGYAALWPTGAAVLVIAAGTTGYRFSADRLLSLRPLHFVAGVSYSFYLWHWPVLVCYLAVTDRNSASLLGGTCVLVLALLMAVATKRLVEDRARELTLTRPAPTWSLLLAAGFLLPVLTAAGGWTAHLDARDRAQEALVADPANYPGAAAGPMGSAPDLPIYPAPADAATDVAQTYADGCNQGIADSTVLECVYGSSTPERTVALVGASHAAHWFPALLAVAEQRDWQVVNLVKGACLFTDAPQTYKKAAYTSCAQWNASVMDRLAELRPDAVFTTATTTSLDTGAGFGSETVVQGYLDRWAELEALGIAVIGVRDTPRLDVNVPECVAAKGPSGCVGDAANSMAEQSPLEELSGVPGNVALIDLTDSLCRSGRCPTVIGNVLVYWDNAHFTATFSRTLAPVLGAELDRVTDW
ncbi:acyltransferase family protein [Nocardiopsis ansamitocini]|uniref:Acyltransferase n=1 Tax=Nocardiopsis ansamitocini TaxID=1670832 RepID=A0A9W6UKE4_9ACTN|nr:acyltransferase family protein [Nocardiopsis ansamitocini]GLU49652.1 acyltransferase [Nocardiopsis ansamitocini]